MKRTLLHSLPAFDALMDWYPLRDTVQPVPRRAAHPPVRPRRLDRDRLPHLLDLLPAAADPVGRESRRARAERAGAAPSWSTAASSARDAHGVSDEMYADARRATSRPSRSWRSPRSARSCSPPTCSTTRCGWTSTSISSPSGPRQGRDRGRERADGRASPARSRFITGAAHGQGRAAALALAREGARIAALDVARPLAYPGYALGSPDDLDLAGRGVPAARAPSA